METDKVIKMLNMVQSANGTNLVAIECINDLEAENAELRARLSKAVELVDLAVGDLNGVYGAESCDFCENFPFCDDHDQSYCDGINFKWEHQAKLDEMKCNIK